MSYITETIRFEPITWQVRKTVKCAAGCGKSVKRQRTFQQTLNPYNRNAEGQPKTRQEIGVALRAEGDEWQQKPETCTACQEATS